MKPISLFLKHSLGVVLLASAIISCKKEDAPKKNIPGYGDVSYFANASGSGIKSFAKGSNFTTLSDSAIAMVKVNWSPASVYVEKIAFIGMSSSFLDTTITVEKKLNIFNTDALAGIIKLPAGSYKDITIKMYCKKSARSEFAFDFAGTFTNTVGGTDSVRVGSSYPFEANLAATDIVINPSDKYKVTFNFDLDKVLTGISTGMLETAGSYVGPDNKRRYSIWKGGSDDEPYYDQVIQNWQTVANVILSKQ